MSHEDFSTLYYFINWNEFKVLSPLISHVIQSKLPLFWILYNMKQLVHCEAGIDFFTRVRRMEISFWETPPLWMTAHPPTPPLGSNTEKKRPQPPIWSLKHLEKASLTYIQSSAWFLQDLYFTEKNISARSEEHKHLCEIPFVAVSSDMLEIWRMLPLAHHEIFRGKFLKICQREGLHFMKMKSPSFVFFSIMPAGARGDLPLRGKIVDWVK